MKKFFRIMAASIVMFIAVIGISIAINKVFSKSKEDVAIENSEAAYDKEKVESVQVFSNAANDSDGKNDADNDKDSSDNDDSGENDDKEEPVDNAEDVSQPQQDIDNENGNIHIGVGPNGEADAFDAKIVWDKLRGEDYEKPDQKIAFLTFDDGPSAEVTPQILDILKKNNVKATFFVVGSGLSSDTSKELLRRAYDDGNAIGNHTYSHRYDKLYPNGVLDYDTFIAEIQETNVAISDALGVDFKADVVRCPGGFFSWKGMDKLKEYFMNNGMSAIDWNAVNGDAETSKPRTADELLARANETMHGSDLQVILMHDGKNKQSTAEMLQSLIDELKAQGYIFKTLV